MALAVLACTNSITFLACLANIIAGLLIGVGVDLAITRQMIESCMRTYRIDVQALLAQACNDGNGP
jgi:hypothetical protein